jgi:hypothetical protein
VSTAVQDQPIAAVRPATQHTLGRLMRTWYRLAIPIVVGLLLLGVTYAAHAVAGISLSDPDYLNPASSAPHGGLALATALRAQGVTIARVTSAAEMLGVLDDATGPSTLFIPAIGYLDPIYAEQLQSLPQGTRIVIVAPGLEDLYNTDIDAYPVRSRWAPRTVAPGCALPEAATAGSATVDGVEYDPHGATDVCYDGGLVDFEHLAVPEILVGASNPFRNDTIGEHGNRALALRLLGHTTNVVWLDVHARPKQPKGSAPPPQDDSGPRFTLPELFPAWLWTGIGMVLLAGVLYAAAAARRLGPPVSEPLPVAARINETIEGRGRLYRRTKDRSSVLRVLQAAAIERIRAALGLPPGAPPAAIVSATAGYLRAPTEEVTAILYGGAPANDADLRAAVASLDALTAFTDPAAYTQGES